MVRAVCSKLSFQYSGWVVTDMLALIVLFSLIYVGFGLTERNACPDFGCEAWPAITIGSQVCQ